MPPRASPLTCVAGKYYRGLISQLLHEKLHWLDRDPIHIFKKICDNSLSRSEICVARSLFEILCVREGELYLPDSFLQLSEINEIISALCTVAL